MVTKRMWVIFSLLILIGLPLAIWVPAKAGTSPKLILPPYDVGEPDYSPELPASQAAIGAGKKLFSQNCARCHGLEGDGKGPVAYLVSPSPRDFTRGIYKIRSTPTGQLPTDRDIFRAVALGLPGSGMPSWKNKLSQEERWQLVHYIKTLFPAWEERLKAAPLKSLPIPKSVPATKESTNRGKQVYEDFGCAECHGDKGLGDGARAGELKDDWGFPIRPVNLSKPWFFRSGSTAEDIARVLLTGMYGTPMPSYEDAFQGQEEDLQHLVNYILSLAGKPPEPELIERAKGPTFGSKEFEKTAEVGAKLSKTDVVINLVGSAWEMWPKEIRVKKGQVVQINFWVTENGLGGPHGHGFTIDGYDDRLFGKAAQVDHPLAYRFVADKAGEFDFYCSIQCDPGQVDATRSTMGIWGHTFMQGTFIVEEK